MPGNPSCHWHTDSDMVGSKSYSIFQRAIISLIITLLCVNINAASHNRRIFTYGAEINSTFTLHTDYLGTFLTPDGLVNFNKKGGCLHCNGGASVYAGINAAKWLNVSLYAGYGGFTKLTQGFPVSLRTTFSLSGNLSEDGILIFADAGMAWCPDSYTHKAMFGKCGGGYRIMLTRKFSLDFLISATSSNSGPHLVDPLEFVIIPDEKVYMSKSRDVGIQFTIGFNF